MAKRSTSGIYLPQRRSIGDGLLGEHHFQPNLVRGSRLMELRDPHGCRRGHGGFASRPGIASGRLAHDQVPNTLFAIQINPVCLLLPLRGGEPPARRVLRDESAQCLAHNIR